MLLLAVLPKHTAFKVGLELDWQITAIHLVSATLIFDTNITLFVSYVELVERHTMNQMAEPIQGTSDFLKLGFARRRSPLHLLEVSQLPFVSSVPRDIAW